MMPRVTLSQDVSDTLTGLGWPLVTIPVLSCANNLNGKRNLCVLYEEWTERMGGRGGGGGSFFFFKN